MIFTEKNNSEQGENSSSLSNENEFKELDNEIEKVIRGDISYEDEKILNEVYKRSEVVGQITLLDWTLRHNPDKEYVEKQKELSLKHIIDNVQELESLSLKELIQK